MVGGDSFGALCYASNALISGQNNPPGPQGKTRIADIRDGLSNTILHAEKYARCSNTTMLPQFQDGGAAWAYCTAGVFPWLPPPMTLPGKAFFPGFCIPALAARGAPDAVGPTSKFQVQPSLSNCDPTRASTAHPGGIQVGLADGSVRTLNGSMSGTTWWAAVTPSKREVLGSDW